MRTPTNAGLGLLCALLVAAGTGVVACSDDDPAAVTVTPGADAGPGGSDAAADTGPVDDTALRAKAVQDMHDVLLVDVQTLADAAKEIQAAAPTPADRGWDRTLDAASLTRMRASWLKARTAYEHIEGALAPLFPDIDLSIDARYDDFLADLVAQGGDAYLFDDAGVTGMHAIERILFTENVPARVVTFEASLPGYAAAALPATAQEAADFKAKLAQKLVNDTATLVAEWTPARIDAQIAYAGLVSLVQEQKEKVSKASTGEEESRYAQRTMADLRDNLEGTKRVYAAFAPWIRTKAGAAPIDAAILAGLASLDATYAGVAGDAIPEPPATWSAENPSPADLATPFGMLYTAVLSQSDASKPTSVAAQLDAAGLLLGFPISE